MILHINLLSIKVDLFSYCYVAFVACFLCTSILFNINLKLNLKGKRQKLQGSKY